MVKDHLDKSLLKFQNQFYKIMVEHLGEEIFVADGNGKILFLNPASVKMIGLPVDQIIGKNAEDLQREGYVSPSCTMEVLRQRKKVNILQKLKDGRTVLATGVPIYDSDQEEIVMVISTSKDVDELNSLLATVESQERELRMKNAEIEKLRDDIFTEEGLIFGDTVMKEIRDAVIRIAPLDITVLLEGETGVGKEVVVRTLHRFSTRKNNSLMKINCAIIPENLMESELFGYESGSFTGAHKEGKQGKVEMADGGTLFLDEIGEMPLHLQVKLLDFLQDGTFTRVGGTEKRKVDARIIAATNRDLKAMCEKGYFRQDLYYRLNVIPIKIPPLRERVADIGILAKYFISNYNTKYKGHKTLSESARITFCGYFWPGNVRELEHVIERAYVMTDGDVINEETVNVILYGDQFGTPDSRVICTDIIPLKEAKKEVERQLISKACEIYGSTYKMADALKVDQSTVVKLLKKHRSAQEGDDEGKSAAE